MQRYFALIFFSIGLVFAIILSPPTDHWRAHAANYPSLLPTLTPTMPPRPTPTAPSVPTKNAEISLLPTITPTPPRRNLLPAPLYFLAPDQQIWQLKGTASHLISQMISQTVTHEVAPITSFDFSPIHGRFVYVTDNQLIEFDPRTKVRTVKFKGAPLPPRQADGRYTTEQSGTQLLGAVSYSPDGTQIAYTFAGVQRINSGLEAGATSQPLLRNVLFAYREAASAATPPASSVDWSPDVEVLRQYGHIQWSPDGKKLLLGSTRWEGYGYEIYDRVTTTLMPVILERSEPFAHREQIIGEWRWSTDSSYGIISNGGYGTSYTSGMFRVDAQSGMATIFDLTSLGVSVEQNPFTPMARATYELPSGVIRFFMATKVLAGRSFFTLAEFNPSTGSAVWMQAEEKRHEFELGEVLWAEDGSGLVYSQSTNRLQWMIRDGSATIDLGVSGNQIQWGKGFTKKS